MKDTNPISQYSKPLRYGLGGTGIALEVVSVICNSIIITAFARVKDLRKTCNVLIINIVLGDLFNCFACAFEIVYLFCTEMHNNTGFTTARRGVVFMSTYLNFLNTSAVACERFIATQFPYQYTAHVNYSRCVAVAIGIWIFSGFMSTIRMYIGLKYVETPLTVILLVLVVVIYAWIYVVARGHIKRDLEHGVRVRHSKTMAAVLTASVTGLCWSPIVCLRILKLMFPIEAPMNLITGACLLLGTCFNLLIYTYRMEDFRKGVKHILRRKSSIAPAIDTPLAIIR